MPWINQNREPLHSVISAVKEIVIEGAECFGFP